MSGVCLRLAPRGGGISYGGRGEFEVQSELNFSLCRNEESSALLMSTFPAASSHECAFACQYLSCMPQAITEKSGKFAEEGETMRYFGKLQLRLRSG